MLRLQRFALRLLVLGLLVQGIGVVTARAQFAEALLGGSPEFAEGFNKFCRELRNPFEWLDEAAQKEACRDLKVGDYRVVQQDDYDSPTLVGSRYVLRRLDEKTHRIEFNLSFKDLKKRWYNGADSSESELALRARANKCLEENQDLLIGPDDEKLVLQIVDKEQSRPEHVKIETQIKVVHDKPFRSNSRAYRASLECSGFIHELLHLAGLADEYRDSSNLPSRKCRATTDRPSIMADNEVMMENARRVQRGGFGTISIAYCKCDIGDGCPGSPSANGCRPGETPGHFSHVASRVSDVEKQLLVNFDALYSGSGMMPVPSGTKPRLRVIASIEDRRASILHGAHVRAILYPGCRAKNSRYYRCTTAWQGQTWQEQLTSGLSDECPQLPAECYQLNWLD